MAVSLPSHGIRDNSVAPGGFNTETLVHHFPDPEARAASIAAFKKRIPMARLGQPHEIAGAAVFLASEDTSYVTSSEMAVNGGAAAPVPLDPGHQ